jgi:hypothetical protein
MAGFLLSREKTMRPVPAYGRFLPLPLAPGESPGGGNHRGAMLPVLIAPKNPKIFFLPLDVNMSIIYIYR